MALARFADPPTENQSETLTGDVSVGRSGGRAGT